MKTILSNLNKTPGIRGCMIVGRDGILIASDFSTDVPEEQMGAIASQMHNAIGGALARLNLGAFERFLIGGSENKLLLVDAGTTILCVLLKRDANMGLVNVEIGHSAEAVAKNSKM
jgi:predicted regulator of Ras-like GTPase activity (Roadblock/LC7/MglB family)